MYITANECIYYFTEVLGEVLLSQFFIYKIVNVYTGIQGMVAAWVDIPHLMAKTSNIDRGP